MTTWPSTIKVSRNNYTETSPDRVIRSNMDTGPQKLRRRSSSAVRPISLRLFLTSELVETLDDFYDLNDVLVFDFIDPRTSVTKRARFTDKPTYTANETMWNVAVKLEYLP